MIKPHYAKGDLVFLVATLGDYKRGWAGVVLEAYGRDQPHKTPYYRVQFCLVAPMIADAIAEAFLTDDLAQVDRARTWAENYVPSATYVFEEAER